MGATAAAAAENGLTLCFVVVFKPGFSKDRGENGLRDVDPFHSSPLCAQWASVSFLGLFLLPTPSSTGCLHHSLPLQFTALNPTSSVLRAALVLLSPVPTSLLAKGISWHKRALAASWSSVRWGQEMLFYQVSSLIKATSLLAKKGETVERWCPQNRFIGRQTARYQGK